MKIQKAIYALSKFSAGGAALGAGISAIHSTYSFFSVRPKGDDELAAFLLAALGECLEAAGQGAKQGFAFGLFVALGECLYAEGHEEGLQAAKQMVKPA